QEIKNIYDDQPELKILFTGSSMMHLDQAKGDLSRRAVMYELRRLSFREYLNDTGKGNFNPVAFSELITSHTSITIEITQHLHPLEHFPDYLRYGYYPYFAESSKLYWQKLTETIS